MDKVIFKINGRQYEGKIFLLCNKYYEISKIFKELACSSFEKCDWIKILEAAFAPQIFYCQVRQTEVLKTWWNTFIILVSGAVDGKYGPDFSLNEYIRNVADLRGTKAMCHEGGCGACIVAVKAASPTNNEMKTFSVNSVSVMFPF